MRFLVLAVAAAGIAGCAAQERRAQEAAEQQRVRDALIAESNACQQDQVSFYRCRGAVLMRTPDFVRNADLLRLQGARAVEIGEALAAGRISAATAARMLAEATAARDEAIQVRQARAAAIALDADRASAAQSEVLIRQGQFLMQQGQGGVPVTPTFAPPQTYVTPRGTVTCQRTGTITNCF
ncbi:hypothetical protein ACE7GA_21320 [Roseomonas sp. CCTCC AB2023176]|uniref:hypothetical protein n=1 Tax=Roseomonas sp. CCTCC AB2023176 TaxID=3342640 RepID=UPI0035DAD0DB